MFKLRVKSRTLRDVVSLITTLVDEGTFILTPEGISFRSMDPSRVSMVDFYMGKSSFEEYSCSENEPMSLVLSNLLAIMKRAGKDDLVELLHEDKTATVKVTLLSKNSRSFTVPLLEADSEEQVLPKLSYTGHATVVSELLNEALEDVALASDHVAVTLRDGSLQFDGKGDVLKAEVEFSKGSDALLNAELEGKSVRSVYPLTYLKGFLKNSLPLALTMVFNFSTDMPVKISFSLSFEGHLDFYLAPRIEVE